MERKYPFQFKLSKGGFTTYDCYLYYVPDLPYMKPQFTIELGFCSNGTVRSMTGSVWACYLCSLHQSQCKKPTEGVKAHKTAYMQKIP